MPTLTDCIVKCIKDCLYGRPTARAREREEDERLVAREELAPRREPEPRRPMDFPCPRNSGEEQHTTKAFLQDLLSRTQGFRVSRHFTDMTQGIPLFHTYSKQLLRSLCIHYINNANIHLARPLRGKYRISLNGNVCNIVKVRLNPNKNREDYNDLPAGAVTMHNRMAELAPNAYKGALNYLLEYEFPNHLYIYNPAQPLNVLNVGVGARDRIDSALLFRHFGSFDYYSVDFAQYGDYQSYPRSLPHSALSQRSANPEEALAVLRSDEHHVANDVGVAGLTAELRRTIDIGLIVHPRPTLAITMINGTLDFIKDDGILLVLIRDSDTVTSRVVREIETEFAGRSEHGFISKTGQLDFRVHGRDTLDSTYCRRDTYYMLMPNGR